MLTPQQLMKQYNLQPHSEGGWYKETYKSSEYIPEAALPERFNGVRVFSTAIYFLLEQGNFSAFHRIKADECWHFYAGDTLLIHIIENDCNYCCIKLGKEIAAGETFQYVVPANTWFAAEPAPDSIFSLAGCTVAPGFDFADFEIADKKNLLFSFPQHNIIINRLCR